MPDAGNVTSGDLQVVMDTSQAVKALNDLVKSLENATSRIESANKRIEKSFSASAEKIESSKKKAKKSADQMIDEAILSTGPKMGPVKKGRTQAEISAAAAERRARDEEDKARRREERESGWASNRERRRLSVISGTAEREAGWAIRKQEKAEQKEAARIERMVLAEKAKVDKAIAANTRIRVAEEKRASDLKLRTEQKVAESQQKTLRMQVARDNTIVNRAIDRSLSAPASVQQQIASILNAPGAQASRLSAIAAGATRQQSVINQLQQNGIAPNIAGYVGGAGGRRPPGWMTPGQQGQPGGVRGFFQRNGGRIASAIGTGLGIGAGAFGVGAAINAGQALIEATQMATAYDRQEIAARNLAGTQENLNKLLAAYAKNSGGAIDQSTQLSDVTRLLATGFASSVGEVEKFVRATRGASIALGKPQDYVTQETQLAISNTSVKRLDQIGLGIDEVQQRIEDLQKANANLTREDAFRTAVIGLLDAKYGALTNTIEGQATGLERLRKNWKDLQLQMGQGAQGPVNAGAGLVGGALGWLTEQSQLGVNMQDPNWKPEFGADRRTRQTYQFERQLQQEQAAIKDGVVSFFTDLRDRLMLMYGQTPPPSGRRAISPLRNPEDFGPNAPGGIPSAPLTRFGGMESEGQDVVRAAYDNTQAIEKSYYEQREQLTIEYESQRTKIIADFGKQMARSEADFQRQRARSLRDYERGILDVLREGRERDAEMREDLDKRVADATEDHTKRVKEIEENYQKDREKAEKDHKERMLKAAGQLDAIGVLEERKRWKRENEEREEGHKEALEDAKEALEEQVKEAREAMEERLKDAREADEKRLQDMALDRERRLADENEDRELEKQRAIEDHNAQLDEMDRLHNEQMTKLKEQSEKETALIEDRLDADLAAVGVYVEGYQKLMRQRDKLIEDWFDTVIDRVESDVLREANPYYFDPRKGPQIPQDYASGLVQTGGSNFNSSSTRNVRIEAGAIAVFTTPGMEMMVGEIVEEKMLEILENN